MRKLFTMSLRHKVSLEQKSQVSDGAGGFETSWESVASLWAGIDKLRSSERFAGGQVTADATHKFTLRYHSGIRTDMRFNWNGRLFNIRVINDIDEKNRILEVIAEEGVAQ